MNKKVLGKENLNEEQLEPEQTAINEPQTEQQILQAIMEEYPQLVEQDLDAMQADLITAQPLTENAISVAEADVKRLEQENERLRNILDGKIRNSENKKSFIGTATGDTASENQDAFLNGFLNN